jgi:UPF0042 nucleotide-binding protein
MSNTCFWVITGQSGSGKSTVLRTLEDEGFFCVDNLPTHLLHTLIAYNQKHHPTVPLAVGMDVREPSFHLNAPDLITQLRNKKLPLQLWFLEAQTTDIIRRYAQTRRKHPLDCGKGIEDAIKTEHNLLSPLREMTDVRLNTSTLSPRQLKEYVLRRIEPLLKASLHIELISFGFKYGLPLEADWIFDARFLPNPYFIPHLTQQTGKAAAVADFVLAHEESQRLLEHLGNLLAYLAPVYQKEGRRYLTVAIGCTGGRHRSVALVEAIAEQQIFTELPLSPTLRTRHRDIHLEI